MQNQIHQRVAVTRTIEILSPFTKFDENTTILMSLNNKKLQNLTILADTQFMCHMLNSTPLTRSKNDCLVILNLSQNKIKTLQGIQKINEIKIIKNLENSSPMDATNDTLCGRVVEISLHNNQIQSLIPLTLCQQFTNLDKLIIQFNKIGSLKGLEKCRMPKLKRITVNNNLLTSVKQLKYCKFTELRILGLQYNKLQSLEELTDVNFPYLLYLSFDKNAIKELGFFKNANFSHTLTTIAGSQNKIYKCNFQGTNFQRLMKLNLSSNQIQTVQGLGACNFPNLQNINLSKNCISCVRFLYRITAPKLVDLNLQNNKVLQLDPFKYATFPKIQSVHLSGNKLPYCLWQLLIGLRKNQPSPIMIITFWNCKLVTNKRVVPLKILKSNFPKLNYLQH